MKLIYSPKAKTQFSQLDKGVQKQIKKYMDAVESLENPRTRGKALLGALSGLWRYRVGDYRIICKIEDDNLIIIALEIGHRKNIYKK